MRVSTVLKILTVLGLAVVIALIAASKALDSKQYQGFLAEKVRAASGLELSFSGPTKIKLGLVPQVSFTGLSLAARPGGPALLYVDRVEAKVALLPLVFRRIQMERLALYRPVVKLAPLPRPQGSLDLSQGAERAPATILALGEVEVEDAVVLWRESGAASDSSLTMARIRIQPESVAGGPLSISVEGRRNGTDFQLAGVVGALSTLMSGKPLPVQVKGTVSGAVVVARGQIADPWNGKGLQMELRTTGDELADLVRRLGLVPTDRPLGAIGPYKVSAHLNDNGLTEIEAVVGKRDSLLLTVKGAVRHPLALSGVDVLVSVEADGLAGMNRLMAVDLPVGGPLKLSARLNDIENGWRLTGIRSSLGRSDFAGELALTQGARPRLAGRLMAGDFHPGELSFPRPAIAEALPSAPQRPSIPVRDDRILSVDPLPLDWLKSLDMTLSLSAARLHAGSALLADAAAEVALSGGRMVVDGASARLGGGALKGEARIDVSGRVPVLGLRLAGAGLDLAALGGDLGLGEGKADLALDLKASGNSRRALAASLDGSLSLSGEVRIAPSIGPLPDVLAALDPAASAEDRLRLRCLMARATAKAGMVTLDRATRLDNGRMLVQGMGSIDLRSEALDLGFAAKGGAWTRLRGVLGAPVVAAEGGPVRLTGEASACRAEAKPRR